MTNAGGRPVTAQDLTRLRGASDPQISPDGRWLAFVSDRGAKKKSQLYAMPADGGEATQLTDLPNGVFGQGGVAWSPDSTRLAFIARVGGWQEPEREEDRGKSRPVLGDTSTARRSPTRRRSTRRFSSYTVSQTCAATSVKASSSSWR